MLSVAICTHNRAEYLKKCLLSIEEAESIQELEVIVIDNASTDHTRDVVDHFKNCKYYYESSIGLSHARNRAIEVAKKPWILFIDDDARVRQDILKTAIRCIETSNFKLISGIFKAHYPTPPPYWLPYKIGNYGYINCDKLQDIGENYIAGGVMLLHIPTLLRVSRFPTDYGMAGNKIGYGEETFIEYKFKEVGIPVGLNPQMVIYHQVLPYKYALNWVLKSAKARGYYSLNLKRYTELIWVAIKQVIKTLYYIILSVFRLRVNHRLISTLMILSNCIGQVQKKIFDDCEKRT